MIRINPYKVREKFSLDKYFAKEGFVFYMEMLSNWLWKNDIFIIGELSLNVCEKCEIIVGIESHIIVHTEILNDEKIAVICIVHI